MSRIRISRVAALSIPTALVIVAGTALADPVFVRAMGLDVWQIGRLENELRHARSHETRLDRELQVVLDRAALHDMMLDDLIAGRLSLVETARRKWSMNQYRDVVVDHLARNCFGPSFEAKMAYDLYQHAITKVELSDRVRQEVKVRLAKEYRVAFGLAIPERYPFQ